MIEFIGLPGCGKTTYINKLPQKESWVNPLDKIYNKNHIVQNINKISPIVHFMLMHPVIFLKAFALLNKLSYDTFFRRIKMFSYVFSVLGVVDLCKNKYPNKNLIMDEGINQVLVYVMYESVRSENIIKRLWTLLRPFMAEHILYFKIEKHIILERLKKRKGNNGSEVNRDILTNPSALDKAIECQDFILSLIKNNGFKFEIYNGEK